MQSKITVLIWQHLVWHHDCTPQLKHNVFLCCVVVTSTDDIGWPSYSRCRAGPFTYSQAPDSKVRGANMGPTWVLSAPDGPHFGPTDLAIWGLLPCEHPGGKHPCYTPFSLYRKQIYQHPSLFNINHTLNCKEKCTSIHLQKPWISHICWIIIQRI